MKYIYLISIACLFFSCKDVQRNDIVGVWKSDDGCVLFLNEDSTFRIKDLPEHILFDNKSKNKLTSTGEWELINFGNNWSVELIFSKNDIIPYCFGNNLLIERTFNITKGHWAIYFYDGDNDEKYFFNKVFSTKK